MEIILCDVYCYNQVKRYDIHGSVGVVYKIDPFDDHKTPSYHADGNANIIALTNDDEEFTAQYAYSPYGCDLGSAGPVVNENPYRFVGSLGVMEELPNLYFMRARYYSADAALFLSTDPVRKVGPEWKSIAYIYVEANPISNVDPEGLINWGKVWSAAKGIYTDVKKAVISFAIGDIIGLTLSVNTGTKNVTDLIYGFCDIDEEALTLAEGLTDLVLDIVDLVQEDFDWDNDHENVIQAIKMGEEVVYRIYGSSVDSGESSLQKIEEVIEDRVEIDGTSGSGGDGDRSGLSKKTVTVIKEVEPEKPKTFWQKVVSWFKGLFS